MKITKISRDAYHTWYRNGSSNSMSLGLHLIFITHLYHYASLLLLLLLEFVTFVCLSVYLTLTVGFVSLYTVCVCVCESFYASYLIATWFIYGDNEMKIDILYIFPLVKGLKKFSSFFTFRLPPVSRFLLFNIRKCWIRLNYILFMWYLTVVRYTAIINLDYVFIFHFLLYFHSQKSFFFWLGTYGIGMIIKNRKEIWKIFSTFFQLKFIFRG